MRKVYIKYLFVLLFCTGLLTGCSSGRKTIRSPEPEPDFRYNREAMRHIINGAIADLLGQTKVGGEPIYLSLVES